MATEFNYVVNVDTTRVMGAMSEVRSQIGMALGGATGFAGAGGLVGGGSDFSGGASSVFGKMMGGMGGGVKFGTFTNEAMAYNPHHGMVQAHTTLEQERAINQGGVAAAAQFKPPGVSAAEFAIGVQSNFIDRNITAKYEAGVAARSSFYAGAAGLAGGELASKFIGTPIGAVIGGSIAKKLGGVGAIKTGRMLGGFGGMMAAYSVADDVIGGAIRGHFADKEITEGITKELGEIAGAGRGLGRTQRYDLGTAAMGAAKNLNMDVQEMGNILALGRQSGMLPTGGADASKAKQQFTDFARAVEEGAQILHTSLAGATQVIKTATSKGMSAEEGVMRAAGAGGAGEWLQQQAQMSAFGSAGAAAGRGMGFTGAQGRGVFMGGLGGSGLSGEETKIMGGRFGVASFVGSTQMAMAKGPMGDMQLMASMSGQALGSVYDLPGQAMSAMSEGGDFLSNMGKFMVHKDEYRRGIGAKGIQTMARQQLSGLGDVIQDIMPGLSNNEAQRLAAQSMGMSPDQAKTLVGSGGGGGGGGISNGALAKARQMEAIQGTALSAAGGDISLSSGSSHDVSILGTLGDMATGASYGAMAGGAIGAIGGPLAFVTGTMGAVGGAVAGLGLNVKRGLQNLFGGPSNAREAAQEYDSQMAQAKSKAGYVDFDIGSAYAFQTADLSGARLNIGSAPGLGGAAAATMDALGYDQVAAGAGSFHAGGGKYYSNADMQDALKNSKAWTETLSKKDQAAAGLLAHDAIYSEEGRAALGGGGMVNEMAKSVRVALARLETGSDNEISKEVREKYNIGDGDIGMVQAGDVLQSLGGELLRGAVQTSSNSEAGNKLKGLLSKKGSFNNSFVRETLGAIIGADVKKQDVLTHIGRAGAVSVDSAIEQSKADRIEDLMTQYDVYERNDMSDSALGGKIWDLMGTEGAADKMMKLSSGKMHASEELEKELWTKATARDDWRANPNRAVKLAQLEMKERGQNLRVPNINKDERVTWRASEQHANVVQALSDATGFLGFDKISKSFSDEANDLMKKVSISDLEKGMAPEDGMQKAKDRINKPRRGAQKAIGWGQQEESMNLINKSLKRTHKMLSTLETKISGMGATPAGTAQTGGN